MRLLWIVLILISLFFSSFSKVERNLIPYPQSRQTLIASHGDVIYDFGGPGDYTNCFCVTTTTLFGSSPMTLNFTEFSMGAPGDNITIYDGPETSDPVLYTNSTGDPWTADRTFEKFIATNGSTAIQSSGPYITIKFVSDFYKGDKGFAADISMHPCPEEWNLGGDIVDGTYRALNDITISGKVNPAQNITLQSFKDINIQPTFEVEQTGLFEANNNGCN